MIETPFYAHLKYFDAKEDIRLSLVQSLKSSRYSRGIREGFVVEESGKDQVYGYFIADVPTYIRDFDEKTLSMTRVKVVRKMIVPFSIDFKHGIMEVYGSGSKAGRVINELSRLSTFKIEVGDVTFAFATLLRDLQSSGMKPTITSLRIRDFSLSSNVLGTYWVRIYDEEEGNKLLRDYMASVTYLGLKLRFDDYQPAVGFFRNGGIKIYNRVNGSGDLFWSLKEAVFGGR